MRILCSGIDNAAIELVEVAIRLRWPDAVSLRWTKSVGELARLEPTEVDLVAVIGRQSGASAAEFCTQVRDRSNVPLIVIAVQGNEGTADEVTVLEAGADDYMPASVGLPEIMARVVALIRRAQPDHAPFRFRVGPVTLDPGTNEVFVGERRVDLTGKEFNLLHLLMQQSEGSVIQRWVLEQRLWPGQSSRSTSLSKWICRLRSKLIEASENEHDFIRTVHGVGYVFTASGEANGTTTEAAMTSEAR